jgi:hypothetical protein
VTPNPPTNFQGALNGRTIVFTWTPSISPPTVQRYEILRGTTVIGQVPGSGAAVTSNIDDNVTGTTTGTWEYTGTWAVASAATKFGGTEHYSQTAAAVATLRFTGTSFQVYGTLDVHHGTATIRVDGSNATTMDCYAAARQEGVVLYTSPNLTNTAHTVTITVDGAHNAASTGNVVPIDRASVTAGTTTRVERTTTARAEASRSDRFDALDVPHDPGALGLLRLHHACAGWERHLAELA